MEAMRGPLAAVRPTAVCDRAPGAPTRLCARPWSPYVCGSRGGAYVQACSVDRSASRSFSAGCALGKEGPALDTPSDPLIRAGMRFCAAYKGGAVVRQCCGSGVFGRLKLGEKRPVLPGSSCIKLKCLQAHPRAGVGGVSKDRFLPVAISRHHLASAAAFAISYIVMVMVAVSLPIFFSFARMARARGHMIGWKVAVLWRRRSNPTFA